jgi:hypothetical protein
MPIAQTTTGHTRWHPPGGAPDINKSVPTPDPRYVFLGTDDGALQVLAKVSADPPPQIASDSYGGWESVPRPRQRGLTVWRGVEAVTLTMTILIDGVQGKAGSDIQGSVISNRPGSVAERQLNPPGPGEGVSVEQDCRTLERMAGGLTPAELPPPKLTLVGAAVPHDASEASQNRWVLNGLEWGDEIRRASDGARVRAFASLTLLLHTASDELDRVQPAKEKPKYEVTKAKAGDTFNKIAARKLGSAKLGRKLADLNRTFNKRFKNATGTTKIPAGVEVRLPTASTLAGWKRSVR